MVTRANLPTPKNTPAASTRPAHRWLDVQVVIATLAMTFTLFIWNLLAGADQSLRQVATVNTTAPNNDAQKNSSVASAPASAPVPFFSAPGPSSGQTYVQPQARPAPLVVTGSSRP